MQSFIISLLGLGLLIAISYLTIRYTLTDTPPIPEPEVETPAQQMEDKSNLAIAYVSANLSELSSEKEVLGGTFYVTEIEAADGRGTVSYEDGHVAYVADFTYSFDAGGGVVIDSFIVREQ